LGETEEGNGGDGPEEEPTVAELAAEVRGMRGDLNELAGAVLRVLDGGDV